MSDARKATHSFTKLVVDDLEKMAAYYSAVFGLGQVARMQGQIGDDRIDEILLGSGTDIAGSSLVLLKFPGGPRPRNGELILGFLTDDLPALLDRVRAAGGGVHAEIKQLPELKLQVAFATDPEGHLSEIVQMLG